MTDEERQAAIRAKVLVARLRRRDPFPSWEYMYDDAADEIERMTKENDRLSNHAENLREDVIRLGKLVKKEALAQSDAATDYEKVFTDICDQLGCAYDNEAALFAIDALQSAAAERRQEELREDERLGVAPRRAQDAEDRPAALAQSDAELQNVRDCLHRARRFVQAVQSDLQRGLTGDQHIQMLDLIIDDIQAALAQSNVEPVAWRTEPECRRALKDAKGYIESSIFNIPSKEKTDEILSEIDTALAQSDAEPIKWLPDANMRTELDRSELVARALLKEIMKQIDCIEAEGNIEWHKRIKLNGELYLPDLAVAVLAVLYTDPPRPDASAGLIEAAEYLEKEISQYGGGDWQTGIKHGLNIAVRHLRRAADRSGE